MRRFRSFKSQLRPWKWTGRKNIREVVALMKSMEREMIAEEEDKANRVEHDNRGNHHLQAADGETDNIFKVNRAGSGGSSGKDPFAAEGPTKIVTQPAVVASSKRSREESDDSDDYSEDNGVEAMMEPLGRPPASIKTPAPPKKDVFQALLENSHRGRTVTSEGSWDNLPAQKKQKLDEIAQQQKRVEQNYRKQFRLSAWDMSLDSGRTKKVKDQEKVQDKFERSKEAGKKFQLVSEEQHRNRLNRYDQSSDE